MLFIGTWFSIEQRFKLDMLEIAIQVEKVNCTRNSEGLITYEVEVNIYTLNDI